MQRVSGIAAVAVAAAMGLLQTSSEAQQNQAASASSKKPASSAVTVDIEVCNNSSVTASTAVSYIPIGYEGWRSEGWWNVDPGGCTIVASTNNAYFYLYAEELNGDNYVWEGDHSDCVMYPGPFDIWDDGDGYCADGEDLVYFNQLHWDDAEGGGTFTWYLDP